MQTKRNTPPTRGSRASSNLVAGTSPGRSKRLKLLLQLYPNETIDTVETVHDCFGGEEDNKLIQRKLTEISLREKPPMINKQHFNNEEVYRTLCWEGVQMYVTRIVVGSGKTDKQGRSLQDGKLYAAEHISGGLESFFRIEMTALDIDVDLPLRFPTKPLQTGIKRSGNKYTSLIKTWVELYQYLCKHKDEYVTVGGPGVRPHSDATKPFRLINAVPVFMHGRGRDCLWCAIINGIEILIGRSSASAVSKTLRREAIVYPSLSSAADRIRNLRLGIELRRVKGPYTLQTICDMCDGVILVRLTQGCSADHVFAVDARAKTIHDSAEKHLLRLTSESLALCAGGRDGKLIVRECRRLVLVK